MTLRDLATRNRSLGMATLFLRRGRRIDVRTTLVVGAFALWFASLAGSWLQIVHLPLPIGVLVAVWVGAPVVTAATTYGRSRAPEVCGEYCD